MPKKIKPLVVVVGDKTATIECKSVAMREAFEKNVTDYLAAMGAEFKK